MKQSDPRKPSPSIEDLIEELSVSKNKPKGYPDTAKKPFHSNSIDQLMVESYDQLCLLNNHAKMHLQQGKYPDCIKLCILAVKFAYETINNMAQESRSDENSSSFEERLVMALLCKAQAFEMVGKYESAIESYEEIVFRNDSYSGPIMEQIRQCKKVALKSKGDSLFKENQFKKAEGAFTAAINAFPTENNDMVLLLSKRASAFMKQERYDGCLKDCESAIKLACNIKDNEGNFKTPLMKDEQITADGLLFQVLHYKAQALEKLRRYEEALQAYSRILTDDLEDSKVDLIIQCKQTIYKELGSSHFKHGRFDEAEKAYTLAMKGLPTKHGDLVLLLNNRAATFLKQSKFERSMKDCESVIKLANELIKSNASVTPMMGKSKTTFEMQLAKASLRKATSLEGLERFEEAKQLFQSMLTGNVKNSSATEGVKRCEQNIHQENGDQLFKKGEYVTAELSYTRAIEFSSSRNGDLVILLNKRADAYLEQEKYGPCFRESISAMELADYCIKIKSPATPIMKKLATTMQTQLIKALTRKARALQGLKKYEDAIKTYEEGVRLDGINCTRMIQGVQECKQLMFMDRGDFYFKMREFRKAEEAYSTAISVSPPDSADVVLLLNNRAKIYKEQKCYNDCLKDFSKAIRLANATVSEKSSETPLIKRKGTTVKALLLRALFHKASISEALKKYDTAIKAYRDLIAIDESCKSKMMAHIKHCQDQKNQELENEIREKAQEKLKKMRDQERKRKAEEEEKLEKEKEVNMKLSNWTNNGKHCDLPTLLGSLDLILWPDVQLEDFKKHNLKDASICKKLYIKVITKIHPDKLSQNSTVEQRLLASRIFQILNDSWKRFHG